MMIAPDRIELSDADAGLLAQASRLMSEALDNSRTHRIALVEEAEGGSGFRLEVPPLRCACCRRFWPSWPGNKPSRYTQSLPS